MTLVARYGNADRRLRMRPSPVRPKVLRAGCDASTVWGGGKGSGMYDDIARAVAGKTPERALRLMFEGTPPRLRLGRAKETELWDFKADCPGPARDERSENAWAHIAADILGFHNNRGGIILFGINDKSFEFQGATRTLDSKQFNDRIRRYIGDLIWVDFQREYIQADQRYLGVALIPPRGPAVARFKSSAPLVSGKRHFERGGTALRKGDSTYVMDPRAADRFSRDQDEPAFGNSYQIDEPYFRILAPDYLHFLPRGRIGDLVEKSMRDPRVAVTSLIGVGGMGKTALATWAVRRAYEAEDFKFIVSTTAKDRELSATGILGLRSQLTSYEDLVDQIVDVLGFPELKSESPAFRETSVRELLTESGGLIYVDNLETVDDKRLIAFLDDLPVGVRAVVTSRRNSVRTAARPVHVPPLSDDEMVAYIRVLAHEASYSHVNGLADDEALQLGRAWDGIPLALRWAIARTKSLPELMAQAEVPAAQRMQGEQLLEFSFRRVFERLTSSERAVLETLSVLEQPIPTEALVAGAGAPGSQVLDAVEELADDALVQRVFDPDRNDYCFTILPITRAFTRIDLQKHPDAARNIQRRLTSWFEASDVSSDEERLVVREIRSGKNTDDSALVDLAVAAEKREDFDGAERLYQQALSRNPRSWRAAKAAGEFYRHRRHNRVEALRLYEVAGANAPKRGHERAVVFREWGLLVRDSGQPNALALAEEKLQAAMDQAPSDPIARHALANCYDKRGAYRLVIELVEPVVDTKNQRTRELTLPLLLRAYEKTNELLKASELRAKLGRTATNS